MNDENSMDHDILTLAKLKAKTPTVGAYNVIISPHVHQRLERHILIIKKLLDRNVTKQSWLVQAFREKLARDAASQEVPKAHTINVRIDEELEKLILQRIEYIKKFRFSYSKKQWVVDAITDKLDRDEEDVEQKLSATKQSQNITDRQQIELLKSEVAELKARLQKNIN